MAQTARIPGRNKFGRVDFETVGEALTSLTEAVREHAKRWPDGQDAVLEGALLCFAHDMWFEPHMPTIHRVAGTWDVRDALAALFPDEDADEGGDE
jgi:hypothetical protein